MGTVADFIAIGLGARVVTRGLVEHIQDGLDFIPDGESVETDTLSFRRTHNLDLYQCCQEIGDDVQSGSYYCGKMATLVAGNQQKYVGLCERHAQGHSRRLRYATPKTKDSLLGRLKNI